MAKSTPREDTTKTSQREPPKIAYDMGYEAGRRGDPTPPDRRAIRTPELLKRFAEGYIDGVRGIRTEATRK